MHVEVNNPLFSLFPQYSRDDLNQILSENSYDANAAIEQIANGALDWNKKDVAKSKKKFKTPIRKKHFRKEEKKEPPHTPLKKQDSALTPDFPLTLHHEDNQVELVEADLSQLDLSKYVVLVPKTTLVTNKEDKTTKNLKSLVLDMGIAEDVPHSPQAPPNTPVYAKPKRQYRKKSLKKRVE